MYSMLDDQNHANKINKLLQDKPTMTKKEISQITGICNARLNVLHHLGMIDLYHTFRNFAQRAKK